MSYSCTAISASQPALSATAGPLRPVAAFSEASSMSDSELQAQTFFVVADGIEIGVGVGIPVGI